MNLRVWKSIKAIILNVGVLLLAAYGLWLDGDPTLITVVAIVMLGLVNGMEFSEFVAAWADVQETDDGD